MKVSLRHRLPIFADSLMRGYRQIAVLHTLIASIIFDLKLLNGNGSGDVFLFP